MLNTEFYDILDAELTQLVEENGFRPALKHKMVEQKKFDFAKNTSGFWDIKTRFNSWTSIKN